MPNRRDIRGLRSGRLTAVSPTSQRSSHGGILWFCTCDCGSSKLVKTGDITTGKTKSCGCLDYNYPAKPHKILGAKTFNRKILRISEMRKDDQVILIICLADPRWIYPANERFHNYRTLIKENGYEAIAGTYDSEAAARDLRRDYIETLKSLILKQKVDLAKGLEALDLANFMNR